MVSGFIEKRWLRHYNRASARKVRFCRLHFWRSLGLQTRPRSPHANPGGGSRLHGHSTVVRRRSSRRQLCLRDGESDGPDLPLRCCYRRIGPINYIRSCGRRSPFRCFRRARYAPCLRPERQVRVCQCFRQHSYLRDRSCFRRLDSGRHVRGQKPICPCHRDRRRRRPNPYAMRCGGAPRKHPKDIRESYHTKPCLYARSINRLANRFESLREISSGAKPR